MVVIIRKGQKIYGSFNNPLEGIQAYLKEIPHRANEIVFGRLHLLRKINGQGYLMYGMSRPPPKDADFPPEQSQTANGTSAEIEDGLARFIEDENISLLAIHIPEQNIYVCLGKIGQEFFIWPADVACHRPRKDYIFIPDEALSA